MSSTTYNDKTEKVGITLPSSLIKQTDKLRGDVKRSTYIRKVEYYLKQGKTR
jgi:metal-responsive CopG/Arc/MetJ family transcriptional regulator